MITSYLNPSFLFLTLILVFSSTSRASVPPENQFHYVNEGEFGPFIVEYDGDYRVLRIGTAPFQLAFYNTTPNAFTLALRMATGRSESLYRWVWEANRGNPVRENATFALRSDGNLVLAEADGRIVWQTGTTNKGVVGFKLLSNGNMVLYNSKDDFIWQSFDSPTDTLLVGQALRIGGSTKLVSRASAIDNVDGPYSLVMEPQKFSMYYKIKNSPKSLLYYVSVRLAFGKETVESLNFTSVPETDENFAYDLTLQYRIKNSLNGGSALLARPKYNSTFSILRLGIDGSLKFYTFYNKVPWGAWEVTYNLFNRQAFPEDFDECQLPERCGKFGLCKDSQCVACPLPSGLMGWSEDCEPVKVVSCNVKDFYYYKIEGVDHYMTRFNKGSGPTKDSDCAAKCTKDCKCLGYFYRQDTMRCWIAYDLKTLTKSVNSTHLGYIKAPKM